MEVAKAELKKYRQSPRKVRLVADSIRGKKTDEALEILNFAPKRASIHLIKLINSAVANAKDKGSEAKDLIISKITVDEGQTLFRIMPRARGSASRIRKRTSRVKVVLSEPLDKGKSVSEAKEVKKTSKNKAKK